MRNTLFFALACFMLIACGQNSVTSAQPDREKHRVEDGLYLVNRELADSIAKPGEGVVIPYSHDFLDEEEEGLPAFLQVDTADYVPLTLAARPDSISQPDKRINLLLSLTPGASSRLADFTGKNLDRHVAIVIGGKAVTIHMVKAKIEGGKLQVTRCTDNACRNLYFELQDNIAVK